MAIKIPQLSKEQLKAYLDQAVNEVNNAKRYSAYSVVGVPGVPPVPTAPLAPPPNYTGPGYDRPVEPLSIVLEGDMSGITGINKPQAGTSRSTPTAPLAPPPEYTGPGYDRPVAPPPGYVQLTDVTSGYTGVDRPQAGISRADQKMTAAIKAAATPTAPLAPPPNYTGPGYDRPVRSNTGGVQLTDVTSGYTGVDRPQAGISRADQKMTAAIKAAATPGVKLVTVNPNETPVRSSTGGVGESISNVLTVNSVAPTGGAGSTNPTFRPLTTDFTRPVLQDAATLANKYGITYGYDNIKNIYKDAVDSAYAAQRKVYDQGTAAYYETIRNNAASLLDTLRKANAGAIATGSTRGVAAAQQLSALLAAAQSGSQGALDLANKIFNLGDTYKADLLTADKDALSTANTASATLGQLSTDQYAAMVQAWAAELAAQQSSGGGGYSSSYSSGGGYSGGGGYISDGGGGGGYSSSYGGGGGYSGIEGTDYAFQSDTDLWNEYAKQLTANGLNPDDYYLDADGNLQLKAGKTGGTATPAGHRLQQEELVQKITSDGIPTKTPNSVVDVVKELLQATDGSGFNGGKYSTAIMNNLTPYEQTDPADAQNVGKLLDTVARSGQSNAGSIGALFDQIPADQRQALYEQFYDRAKLADQRYSWVPTNTKTGEGYWTEEKQNKINPRLINSAADWLDSQTNREQYTIQHPDFKLFPNDIKISTSVDQDFQELSDKDFLNRTAVPMLNELYATGKPLEFNWDTPGEDAADQHRKDTAKARYNELIKKYGYDKIIKAYEDAEAEKQWRASQTKVKNDWDKTRSGKVINGLLNAVKGAAIAGNAAGGKIKEGMARLADTVATKNKLANVGAELKRYEPKTGVDAYTMQRRNIEAGIKDAAARVALQKSLIPKYTPGMPTSAVAAQAAANKPKPKPTPSYIPGMPTSAAAAQAAANKPKPTPPKPTPPKPKPPKPTPPKPTPPKPTPSYIPGMPTSAAAAQAAANKKKK